MTNENESEASEPETAEVAPVAKKKRGRPPKKKVAQPKPERPPKPPPSRELGSKTPQLVAWVRVFEPETYDDLYRGRTIDEESVARWVAKYDQDRS